MATAIDFAGIVKAIHEAPLDPMAWLALADAYEEQGAGADTTNERWLACRLQTDKSQLVVRTTWAPAIRKAAGNKGRKPISVTPATEVELYGDYWDGGSREEWFVLELGTGRAWRVQGQGWNQPAKVFRSLTPGVIVIRAGIFSGKKATPHVYCHPLDLPRLSA